MIKVGTYNLGERGRTDRAVLDAQLDMLAGLRADVWALQECNGWEENHHRLLNVAADTLGMRPCFVKSNHDGCHLTLMVRETGRLRVLEERHDRSHPLWHAKAHVVVSIDGRADPAHFLDVHSAPSSPIIRQAEAELFQLYAKLGDVIAAGDYNAAPASGVITVPDGVNPEHARRKLDRSAAEAIEAAGFVDVGAHCGNQEPTVGFTSADRLAFPCDRAYTTLPGSTIAGFEVIHEIKPKGDHRPAVAAFHL